MAPTFVQAGAGVIVTTGSGSVTMTGVTIGNIVIAQVLNRGTIGDGGAGAVTGCKDLTGVAGSMSEIVNGGQVGNPSAGLVQLFIGRATATSVSMGLSVGASSEDQIARLYEFSGCVAGDVGTTGVYENVTAGNYENAVGTSTTATDGFVTTLGSNRLALQIVSLSSSQAVGPFTGMSGGTWAEAVAEYAPATGLTGTLQLQQAAIAAAGTIDGGSLTISSTSWGSYGIALLPGSAATVPSFPLSPSATGGNAQVALTWNPPGSNGGSAITGYKIYRSVTTNTETLLASPAGTGTSYTDLTAANGTTYFYKITAVNAIGESALSAEVSATPTLPSTAPSAPQSLGTTPGNGVVALSWSLPATNGGSAITGYKIYRSTTPGSETLLASPAGTGLSYNDFTVVNGTSYFYKVSAINAIGESVLSNESSATPNVGSPVRTLKRLYGPALLTNAAATLYTCPAATVTVIRHIHVSNPTGGAVGFTLSIGASAAATRLWDGYPIPANDVLDHYQDFALAAGDLIQGLGGTTLTLNITIDGYEIANPAVPPPPPPAPIPPSDTLFPSDTSP